MKVLIVEDDADIRRMWSYSFSDPPVEAASAAEVFALEIDWSAIDGAIVDYNLAGPQSGEDVIKWMTENHSEIPCLLISAFPLSEIPETLRHLYVQKPVRIQDVIDRLGGG